MDLSYILVRSLNSVQYGFLLFLVASGLTLIFGILGVINLAHGSFFMIGAYLAYQAAKKPENRKSLRNKRFMRVFALNRSCARSCDCESKLLSGMVQKPFSAACYWLVLKTGNWRSTTVGIPQRRQGELAAAITETTGGTP